MSACACCSGTFRGLIRHLRRRAQASGAWWAEAEPPGNLRPEILLEGEDGGIVFDPEGWAWRWQRDAGGTPRFYRMRAG